MSDVRAVVAQNTVPRVKDDAFRNIRLGRGGEIVTIPWTQALIMEGKVFGVQFGDATTDPVGAGTFGAGVVDLDEFDFLQTIPATVTVMPLYYEVSLLAIGTAGETGLHVVWGSGGVKHASGITPVAFNMKAASSNTSLCTLSALSDDAGTAIVPAGIVCSRITTAITGAATGMNLVPPWSALAEGGAPMLKGAASTGRQIAAFFPAIGGTGYFVSRYAEFGVDEIE